MLETTVLFPLTLVVECSSQLVLESPLSAQKQYYNGRFDTWFYIASLGIDPMHNYSDDAAAQASCSLWQLAVEMA